MPFDRPTLQDLITRAAADLDSRLTGTDSKLRRSNTGVLARVAAGLAHTQHGHLEWISKQLFTKTADEESLVIDGEQLGVIRKPAKFARGNITAPGLDGSVIPAGTSWVRGDGVEYQSTADAVIAGGTAAVSVIALEAGSDGNAASGVTLTLFESLEGVNPVAPVGASGLTGGADIEDLEDYRARVQERKRRKPAGGSKYDYIAWAEEIGGVSGSWVIPRGQGPGTTDLVILADAESTGSVVPGEDLLAEVRAAIVEQCPNDIKFLRVLAPVLKPLDVTLSATPDTAAVRGAVAAELADLVDRSADPKLRRSNPELTIPVSQLNEAISLAAGETDHELTLPAAAVIFSPYELPVMGEITWL